VDDAGTDRAGASARREHERRRAADEQRIRDDWGRLGGLAVALTPERQSTAAWAVGAVGEEAVGRRLDALAGPDLRVLHDRRLPRSRANIDHLVVARSGVWVVDAKRYTGRPELRVEGGFLRPRVEKLLVRGRDQTRLAEGVQRQLDRVAEALPGVPLRGVLCFVEADWPLVGGDFSVRGVSVCWPRRLVRLIERAPDRGVDVDVVAAALGARFRRA
jgi:hypothetical protein